MILTIEQFCLRANITHDEAIKLFDNTKKINVVYKDEYTMMIKWL